MLFFCKRWTQFFLPIYLGAVVLCWLMVLFEIILVKRNLFILQELLIISLLALGAAQIPILLLSSALATGLLFSNWKDTKICLLWNSIGVSTKRILCWSWLPLGCIAMLAYLSLHFGGPFLAKQHQRIAPTLLPIRYPITLGEYTLFVQNKERQRYLDVKVITRSLSLQADSAYISENNLILEEGSGQQDKFSFSFEEMVLELPKLKQHPRLTEQSDEELFHNGGRREKMELIKRNALPLAFPLLMNGISIVILHKGQPIRYVLIGILVWWALTRAIEMSQLTVGWAWLPLFCCASFCAFAWRRLR